MNNNCENKQEFKANNEQCFEKELDYLDQEEVTTVNYFGSGYHHE